MMGLNWVKKMSKFDELREKILPVLQPYVQQIAVFGSYARGEEVATSDIDILVELRPISQRPSLGLRWFGLEVELTQLLGRQVELVTNMELSPYIRPFVEKDLVIIYEER